VFPFAVTALKNIYLGQKFRLMFKASSSLPHRHIPDKNLGTFQSSILRRLNDCASHLVIVPRKIMNSGAVERVFGYQWEQAETY
jgi:hypothetical protein